MPCIIKIAFSIRYKSMGASENAVRIQICVALIAYLVLRAAQACQNVISQPLAFTRLIRINLMHRRPIDALRKQRQPPPIKTPQLSLFNKES